MHAERQTIFQFLPESLIPSKLRAVVSARLTEIKRENSCWTPPLYFKNEKYFPFQIYSQGIYYASPNLRGHSQMLSLCHILQHFNLAEQPLHALFREHFPHSHSTLNFLMAARRSHCSPRWSLPTSTAACSLKRGRQATWSTDQ